MTSLARSHFAAIFLRSQNCSDLTLSVSLSFSLTPFLLSLSLLQHFDGIYFWHFMILPNAVFGFITLAEREKEIRALHLGGEWKLIGTFTKLVDSYRPPPTSLH